MGTRADFYVGKGKDAEWLWSLAFDGYRIDDAMNENDTSQSPDYTACWQIKTAKTEAEYRSAVATLLAINSDATIPDQGWPWPWEDSSTTDYAYCFSDGCKVFSFGRPIVDGDTAAVKDEWPDMSQRANVTYGHRSGLLIIGVR